MTATLASGTMMRLLTVPVGERALAGIEDSIPGEAHGFAVSVADRGTSRAAEIVAREAIDAALVVAAGADADDAIRVVERLLRAGPDLAIVVLIADAPEGFVDRAVAAGAQDVLAAPEAAEQVAAAVRKAYARLFRDRTAPPASATAGRVIAIVGPKGGSGKTLTATNLACSLAQCGDRTLLIDLDLEFGDCAIVLGLSPDRTIYDLFVAPGALDEEKLAGYVTRHAESGLDVLIAPVRPDQADAVTVERIEDLVHIARGQYAFIVIDSAPAFSAIVIATVDAADEVVLLASMDVPSLKDARLGLDTLELMGRRRTDVRVVLNRAGGRGGLSARQVEEALERTVDVLVPSDPAVPTSYNAGRPLVVGSPRGGVARSIVALRTAVSGRPEPSRRRLFGSRRS